MQCLNAPVLNGDANTVELHEKQKHLMKQLYFHKTVILKACLLNDLHQQSPLLPEKVHHCYSQGAVNSLYTYTVSSSAKQWISKCFEIIFPRNAI